MLTNKTHMGKFKVENYIALSKEGPYTFQLLFALVLA